MSKTIQIIINPDSGNNEPILSFISDTFRDTDIVWDVWVTKKKNDAFEYAKKALEQHVDVIGVYGGDGTVMQVARALFKTAKPLVIFPGGTANVMAKELGIPENSKVALELFRDGKYQSKVIDMGMCNDQPFVLRVNAGTLATMVQDATAGLKETIGQAAYAVAAIKQLVQPQLHSYTLKIDGQEKVVQGVSLSIANSGNVGIPGVSFLPGINISDSLLDVIVFKNDNIQSLVSWAGSAVTGNEPNDSIEHWKAKEIFVTFDSDETVLCDDEQIHAKEIKIQVIPQSLTVLVPQVAT